MQQHQDPAHIMPSPLLPRSQGSLEYIKTLAMSIPSLHGLIAFYPHTRQSMSFLCLTQAGESGDISQNKNRNHSDHFPLSFESLITFSHKDDNEGTYSITIYSR